MNHRLSETGPLETVVLKHARDAFESPERIAQQWRSLGFTGPPDFHRACDQYDHFAEIITSTGADICWLPGGRHVGLDSIYARDASIVAPSGLVLCRMGKPLRIGEPEAQQRTFLEREWPVLGSIEPPGSLEGGDVVWLGPRTIAVGRGYRTNDAGIAQLRHLLADSIDELIVVPLPHWRGASDVFHLMSIISPVDRDLAVVYAPLLPVPFREWLVARGYTLVDVPDAEFESMGANVLALSPRRCLMVNGNPETRARLEAVGAAVLVYDGSEISLKGGGGPTCLTRPIARRE